MSGGGGFGVIVVMTNRRYYSSGCYFEYNCLVFVLFEEFFGR